VAELVNLLKIKIMIEMQEFDLGDCPYQINQFIEKNFIERSRIFGFSHSDKTVIMYYKPK
jgi:hypothetical protein